MACCNQFCTVFLRRDGSVCYIRAGEEDIREHTGLKNISQVDSGYEHFLCLDSDGYLWGFGTNINGELGKHIEHTQNFYSAYKISERRVASFSCGGYHSAFIDFSGDLYVFGRCDNGQLGMRYPLDKIAEWQPRKVETKNVVWVVCTLYGTFYEEESGDIRCAGLNESGELGVGDNENKFEFVKFPLRNVKIDGGYHFTLALTDTGDVYYMGYLGLRMFSSPHKLNELQNILLVSCGYMHSVCLDKKRDAWLFGNASVTSDKTTPTKIQKAKEINFLSASYDKTFVQDYSHRIWSFNWRRTANGNLEHPQLEEISQELAHSLNTTQGYCLLKSARK